MLIGIVLGASLPLSVNAYENSQVQFTKDMRVSITTVFGTQYNHYDALLNKPLAQLVSVKSYTPSNTLSYKPANSVFATAMQIQDKIQYYYAVIEETFSSNENSHPGQECKTSRVAKLFSW